MKEEYWEQFMTTGRIADYLSYKAESGSSESRCLEEQKEQAGVRSGESDCFPSSHKPCLWRPDPSSCTCMLRRPFGHPHPCPAASR